MKILSIIIPSYNTAVHVDRCAPYYLKCKNLDKMEILFINDGSKDDTVEKITPYVLRRPDAMRILNKENGGHGSVINLGIKEATGKYFKVVDGDDWIEPENLDRLVEELEEINADIILNPYYKVSQVTGKRTLHGIWDVKKNKVIDISELPDNILGLQLHEWTIKTRILKDNDIRFTEKCYYEDFEYTTFPIPYIRSLIFLDYPVYDYLIDQISQSVSDKNVYKNYLMSKKIMFDSIAFYKKHTPMGARANKYFVDTLINGCKQHYNIYLRNGDEADSYRRWSEFDGELKQYGDVYEAIGKKHKYIMFARVFKRLGFTIDSILLRMYKRMKG